MCPADGMLKFRSGGIECIQQQHDVFLVHQHLRMRKVSRTPRHWQNKADTQTSKNSIFYFYKLNFKDGALLSELRSVTDVRDPKQPNKHFPFFLEKIAKKIESPEESTRH